MSKKEYILQILNAIENYRPLAKDIKRFVLLDKFDNDGLDGLTEILGQTINQHLSGKAKEKLEASVNALQKIREMEKQDMMNDEAELAQLDAMIEHL